METDPAHDAEADLVALSEQLTSPGVDRRSSPPCPTWRRGGEAGDRADPGPGRMRAMGQVVATAERIVRAPAEHVIAALADYAGTCARGSLPEQFSDYRVEAGGQGAGTRVHWRFAATSKRVREQVMTVTQPARRTRWSRPTPTPRWSPPGRCTPPTPA